MMMLDRVHEIQGPSASGVDFQMFRNLVNEIRASIPLDGRLHPGLIRLAEYDRANRSDYLHTLEVYLENDCNAQKCGRLLYLHRNSLVYRVRRIQEIGGFDLSDPEERSYLRFSLLLEKCDCPTAYELN